MSFTYVTDTQAVQAHQDSRFGRIGYGRGARAESSLTVIARALRRARHLDEGTGHRH